MIDFDIYVSKRNPRYNKLFGRVEEVDLFFKNKSCILSA